MIQQPIPASATSRAGAGNRSQQAAANASPQPFPIRGKTSPYGFFVKMCYEEHRRKFPNEHVLVTEISKKCSEKWKTMNELEKKRFIELAEMDSQRYATEIAAVGGPPKSNKKRRAKKDPNLPKRSLSAFFFFSNERRSDIAQKNPSWKVGQVAQELGRVWKALSDEERQVYEKLARDDKERYNAEMKSFRDNHPPQGTSSVAGPSAQHQQQPTTIANTSKPEEHEAPANNQSFQVQYVEHDGTVHYQTAFIRSGDANNQMYSGSQPSNETYYENA